MNKYTKYKALGELETSISGKLLFLMLQDIVDSESQIIIPQRQIAENLGINRSTVSRNMRRLERIGAVRIVATFNEYGGQMPNKFIVED